VAEERMSDEQGDQHLNEILAAYLQSAESGQPLSRDELLAQHPEVADELREFLAQHEALRGLVAADLQSLTPSLPKRPRAAAPIAATVSPEVTLPLGPSYVDASRPGTCRRCFGDYELLEEIARGGMGVVYKARQISLNRTVALKMILAGQLASEDDVRRFHTEAEAAANLDHAGIVPIYEVGQCEGQHFFSMGYVEGASLAGKVAGGPLESREAAGLVMAVAEAVHYAHQKNVIHRDLKPANILLDSLGRPRVTDFGLAKRVTGDRGLTASGQILGTPSYMSPEQASAKLDLVGPHSDVYSLGTVLYELLTGRPPFRAASPVDTLMLVIDTHPVPPRLLNPQIPRDLETVTLKCLQKEPALRYATAQELADDLRRFLQGDPIRATSVNLLDRVTRALVQTRNEEHFKGWGVALMAFGTVILLAHVWMCVMTVAGFPPFLGYWVPRLVMLVALAALLWRARPQSLLPTSSVERPIWAAWIGYLLAVGVANGVLAITGRPSADLYPISALLSGMGFFVMGSVVWGGCCVIGLLFLAASPLLAVCGEAASLVFGLLWFLALGTVGGRYWWRGRGNR
jgi:predicted Ser/Thr protein kinase